MDKVAELIQWVTRENRRVEHEWMKWDESAVQAAAINDAQCARLASVKPLFAEVLGN